jgi:FKBP-type peptidyl-prolyl cis-trans isomerase (trigger factor)
MKDYLESLKLTEEEYKEKHLKEDAKLRVSWELILNKIMELEPVKVTKAELNKEIEKIKAWFQNSEVLKRLEELYQEWNKYYEELKTRLSYKKLIDSFFEKEKKEAKK